MGGGSLAVGSAVVGGWDDGWWKVVGRSWVVGGGWCVVCSGWWVLAFHS